MIDPAGRRQDAAQGAVRPGRILVTGASGFVARALGAHLGATNRSWQGIARNAVPGLPAPAPAIVGDYATVDFRPLLEEVDCVVHLAALTEGGDRDARRDASAYLKANRDVTGRLAEAAVAAGVRRIVLVSSIKACGESTRPAQPLQVDAPCAPEGAYATSKAAGERALWNALRGSRTEGVVLRPTIVYGPGGRGNFAALVRAVDKGWPLPFRGIDNRRSLLYVGNAAAGIAAAIDAPSLAGRSWPIADREVVSTSELVAAIATRLGRPARLFRMPPALLMMLARGAGRPGLATRLVGSLEVDAAAFWNAARVAPPYAQGEGLDNTIAAWRNHA